MIPLREQEVIRQRFEQELRSRVRIDYFTQRPSRIIIPGRQDCPHCEDTRAMLQEIASLSPRVSLTVHEFSEAEKEAAALGIDAVPGIVVRGQTNRPLRFFGMPFGSQFPVFVETLIEASTGAPGLAPETTKQLRKVRTDVHLRVLVIPTCRYSAAVAHTAFRLGLAHPRVQVDVIEIGEFPHLAQQLAIRVTPTVLIGDEIAIEGALNEAQLTQRLLKVVEGKGLSTEELQGNGGTPFAPPSEQSQRPVQSPSGLILPR